MSIGFLDRVAMEMIVSTSATFQLRSMKTCEKSIWMEIRKKPELKNRSQT